MRIFKEESSRENISILEELPYAIEIHQGCPAIAHFRSGEKQSIGCLKCLHPRCLFFDKNEIECDYIDGFPNDKSEDVCPVEALTWDTDKNVPVIDSSRCINCGICVSRCPVGALFFDDSGVLSLYDESANCVGKKIFDDSTQTTHTQQIGQLRKVPRAGVSLNASDEVFESIYQKLFRLNNNYHNLLGRNLLISLGCQCAIRRVGDVYTRMDAVYLSSSGSFGAAEIEFGRDTLDAARGILDDIAVLYTRYGVYKRDNKALVVCLQLPNARQGYWQVVKDINVVEEIKIGTITVGALMLLLWNGCILEPENDRYYIDYDNMDLRRIICYQLDCDNLPVSDKELGIFEPLK